MDDHVRSGVGHAACNATGTLPISNLSDRCRVLVIRDDNEEMGLRLPEKKARQEALVSSVASLGIRPEEAGVLKSCLDTRFFWPRNLAWKSLPEVSRPRATIECTWVHGLAGESLLINGVTSGLVAKAQIVLIERSALEMSHLEAVASALCDIPICNRPIVMHFDRTRISPVPGFDRIVESAAVWNRFIYNHTVNMVIIASRALYQVFRHSRVRKELVEKLMPKYFSWHDTWKFGLPLALQMLHAIGRHTEVPARKPFSDQASPDLPWLLANGLPFIEEDAEGSFNLVWRGSGKYPPMVTRLGKIKPWKDWASPSERVPLHPVFDILIRFKKMELIEVGGAGVILTEMGKAFLDLIGDTSCDPDVLLRWRDAEGLVSADNIPAMDRWINTTFRAMKRRMAFLPASPFVEDGQSWSGVPDNAFVARARLFSLDSLTAEQRAEVDRAVQLELRLPPAERRIGYVQDDFSVDPEPPTRIWAGVPIGVFYRADARSGEPDFMLNMDDVDTEAERVVSEFSPLLGHLQEHVDLQTVEVQRVDMECQHFRELEPVLPRRNGDDVGNIVLGQVLVLPDIYKAGIHLARKLRAYLFDCQDSKSRKDADGVMVYGDLEHGMTVTYGMVVGAYNYSLGRGYVDKKLADWRMQFPVERDPHYRFFNSDILDHPDISDRRCWIVRPDGRFEPCEADENGNVIIA